MLVEIDNRGAADDSGVVEEDIDPSEFVDRSLNGSLAIGCEGDIDRLEDGAASGRGDFLSEIFGRRGIEISDSDGRSLARKSRAVAWPIPEAAPVIKAVLLWRVGGRYELRNSMLRLLVCVGGTSGLSTTLGCRLASVEMTDLNI